MLTSNIKFKNFSIAANKNNVIKLFKNLKENFFNGNEKILLSLTKNYRYSFDKKLVTKYKKFSNFSLIGMGGSIFGSKAIYDFLKHKIKKNFYFSNNLQEEIEM